MSFGGDLVLKCMDEQDVTVYQLAQASGEVHQATRSKLKLKQDLEVEQFVQYLANIGYELSLVYVEYRHVTEDFAEKVIMDNKPKGLYWTQCESDGNYWVIDNRKGIPDAVLFPDYDLMMGWLKVVTHKEDRGTINERS